MIRNSTLAGRRIQTEGNKLSLIGEVHMLRKLCSEQSGQDMIEYGMLASLISIVAIATLHLFGPIINAFYQGIQAALV